MRAPDDSSGGKVPAGAPEQSEEMEDAFSDWAALNAGPLACGHSGDLLDLRLRLNAAFAKASNSREGTPSAAWNSADA